MHTIVKQEEEGGVTRLNRLKRPAIEKGRLEAKECIEV